MGGVIYLDFNATTPIAPEVLEAMVAALRDLWGNPSSSHPLGAAAARGIASARADVASLLGSSPEEIVFTSGGTESDNAAVLGVVDASAARGRHVVTSSIEHPAVEQACRRHESRGGSVTRIGVDGDGRVDPAEVAAAVRDDTVLVSIIHAHNETGVVQPIRAIAELLRPRVVPFHTDASQSVGKIPVDIRALGVDLLTVAGHKLYAPKGVGALFVRESTPFHPQALGGGQERGRRAGTESVSQIVGLGAACRLARRESVDRPRHLEAMRDRLEGRLRSHFADLVVHGLAAPRLPNTLFAAIPGADASVLLEALEGVAASAGSACHAGRHEPARVLREMRVHDTLARATLRLSTGRTTTQDDVDRAAERIAETVRELRG